MTSNSAPFRSSKKDGCEIPSNRKIAGTTKKNMFDRDSVVELVDVEVINWNKNTYHMQTGAHGGAQGMTVETK